MGGFQPLVSDEVAPCCLSPLGAQGRVSIPVSEKMSFLPRKALLRSLSSVNLPGNYCPHSDERSAGLQLQPVPEQPPGLELPAAALARGLLVQIIKVWQSLEELLFQGTR